MDINLTNIGKRFNRDWIFRNLSFQFSSGKRYAITGPNGSGKSTLLQIIAGATTFNEGNISYSEQNTLANPSTVFSKVAMVAPYMELVEEMTPIEFYNFHEKMKGWMPSFSIKEIIDLVQLSAAANKQIRYFSSGMKQRIKLGQAFFSNAPILLLDEPLTNLDEAGITLYHHFIQQYHFQRLIIISSNDLEEYNFCDEILSINDYK